MKTPNLNQYHQESLSLILQHRDCLLIVLLWLPSSVFSCSLCLKVCLTGLWWTSSQVHETCMERWLASEWEMVRHYFRDWNLIFFVNNMLYRLSIHTFKKSVIYLKKLTSLPLNLGSRLDVYLSQTRVVRISLHFWHVKNILGSRTSKSVGQKRPHSRQNDKLGKSYPYIKGIKLIYTHNGILAIDLHWDYPCVIYMKKLEHSRRDQGAMTVIIQLTL